MSRDETPDRPDRVMILAPTGRDGELAREVLSRHSIPAEICSSLDDVIEGIRAGAGAAMITEEALHADNLQKLSESLERQPAWSEFPILVFTSIDETTSRATMLEDLGLRANITLVDRPIRIETLVSSVRSVLRSRRHQYDVRDLLHELELRISERDEFLAMLGHELRNPLYAIVLACDEESDDEGSFSARLDVIRRQADRLQRLVDDLLDISRVTRGKLTLEIEKGDLRSIIEDCVTEMRARAREMSRRLELSLPDEPLTARYDPIRIAQVITNLLSNAIKYTGEGGRISVSATRDDERIRLVVEDDGDGIDPDVLPTIFDLFTQVGTREDVHQGGLGLGLTLVERLVEMHGGEVEAFSEGRGKGSRFTVWLPAADPSPEGRTVEKKVDSEMSTEGSRKLLLVEDNPDVRELLAIRLKKLGYEVLQEGAGPAGVERAIAEKPEAALVDIGLPGFDGHEVARRIRSELGDQIVLIAVTGYGQAEDHEKALDAGFDEHLTKPVKPEELHELLDQALAGRVTG